LRLARGCICGSPAADWVIGGRDPGVYVNEGIQIAQSGRSSPPTGSPRQCRLRLRDLFFPSHNDPSYYSVRFMGFHLRDPECGTVTGQFPQGYPSGLRSRMASTASPGRGGHRMVGDSRRAAVYFAATRLSARFRPAAAAGSAVRYTSYKRGTRDTRTRDRHAGLLFAALLAHAYAHEGRIDSSDRSRRLCSASPVHALSRRAGRRRCGRASLLAHVGGHRARAGLLRSR
jgi:hypothetical protein